MGPQCDDAALARGLLSSAGGIKPNIEFYGWHQATHFGTTEIKPRSSFTGAVPKQHAILIR